MIFLVRPLGIHCKRVLNVMASSKNKRPSGKVYLQVLGTSTVDTSASLLLFTDSQRYIFNCGEGTQRIFNEYKLRFTRLTNIFFTRVCWEYIGGLPGMAMTLRDNGKSDIGVYGPTTLSDFIKATRFFLHCEKLNFDCIGFAGEKDEKYEDENLTIWPVVLNKIRKETLSLAKETVVDKSCTMTSRSLESSSASNKAEEPSRKRWKSDDNNSAVLCYICQLATLPGKFLPEKAKQLGVPRGPLFGELHSGKTVTLKDGTQIHPEQVMEAAQPGPVFMIVDCPSVEYVSSLVTNDLFSQHWMDGCKPALVVIVHLTPQELFQHHPEYTEWRKRFGDNVTHLLINNDVCGSPLVFQSQATIQCKLHTIAPDMFPLLYSTEIPALDNKDYSLPTNCFPGENCLKFHLRPSRKQGLDMSDKPDVLDVKSIITETQVLLGIKTERHKQGDTNLTLRTGVVKETRTFSTSSFCGSSEPISESKQISRILQAVGACCSENSNGMSIKGSMESKADKKDFGVVFIGTGAAIPSKYRNVSSTLINMSEHRSLLLDCGEGTYGQLYRHYGKSLDVVLQQISCVFISHIHADHHLGLIQILQQREKHKYSQGPPLLVVGPKKIQMWLHEYNNWCEDIDYRFVDSAELAHPSNHCHHVQDVLSELEASEVKTVPVIHCPEAYGLVLTHRTGWKLVYSGDTRPCAKLIEAGTGADLLIHEATLEDDLTAEALEKMHSTTTEAIESGLKMGARFIMLNHFSQRYPKIPVFSEQFTKHTGIAFDHMKVRSSNFSRIPELLDPLKIIFSDEIDEMKKAT